MAAVAGNPLHEAHTQGVFLHFLASVRWLRACLELSENWDDDFDFGHGNGRPSTSSNKSHTSQPPTRPSNATQRRPSSTSNGGIFSMASSTMEDRFLPETPDTNYHQLALRNIRKIEMTISKSRRGITRLGLHLRILRRHYLCRSSHIITNQHLSPEPFPRSPTASVFSVPNNHPYLFIVDPSCLRYPSASDVQPCLVPPFRRLYAKNDRGGGYGRRAVPSEKGESSCR